MRIHEMVTMLAALMTLTAGVVVAPNASWADGSVSAPVIRQRQPLGRQAVDVLFSAPDLGGGTLTRYDIWVSDDNGVTWVGKYTACAPASGQAPGGCGGVGSPVDLVVPVPEGSARIVKVRAVVDGSEGPWSDTLLVKTKGGRAMRVYVKTPDGVPVVGGSVSWSLADGSAKSSVSYGLTDGGYIDFPQVPAGPVNMKLTDGELPDGVTVTGNLTAVLGFKTSVVTIPRPPQAARVIQVNLPNGLPVSGVSVDVNSEDMTDTAVLQGFTFELPNSNLLPSTPDVDQPATATSPSDNSSVINIYNTYIDESTYDAEYWDFDTYDSWTDDGSSYLRRGQPEGLRRGGVRAAAVNPGPVVASGATNTMGRFVVQGFTVTVPTATVSYDDGAISQTQTVQLNGPLTNVELDYVPYLAPAADVYVAPSNAVVAVPVAVAQASASGFRASKALARAGVKVALVAPRNAAKGTCKGVAATYSTNSAGKAVVKVCATKSGNYRLMSRTKGTLSMGAVRIHVKGAAPMRPRKVDGKSLAAGVMTLSWKAPEYSGGAKAVTYKVTLSVKGSKAITKNFTSGSGKFTGLKHATHYKVSVSAVTKYGTGDAAVIQVPVV